MVEVFKTNVQEIHHAEILLKNLSEHFPSFKINFDLDDCDKILRVEGTNINPHEIIELIKSIGYECEVLLD